ncbi:methylation-associated defense system helix-turn-helix domain-containing protein MAD1 [Burkholderia sp. LMG 32019]|uniref:methylation-associated defense system helix-turn-helix domain-containing protein MAD1 n=1 Tax=Burkholderia sp. LMG 32019 TaxID=3158173 RepID=UPI003C2F0E81
MTRPSWKFVPRRRGVGGWSEIRARWQQGLSMPQEFTAQSMKILYYCALNSLLIPPIVPTPKGEILTIKEVADYLKVTERTIYRLAGAKKIPAFKVGGAWRFSRSDIDCWIEQQSTGEREPLTEGGAPQGERK